MNFNRIKHAVGGIGAKRLALAVVALVLIVTAVHYVRTSPTFMPPAAKVLAEFTPQNVDVTSRTGRCFITDDDDKGAGLDKGVCLRLDQQQPNILLMGDSYAAHLWHGLRLAWPNANVLQATANGCQPLLRDNRIEGNEPCVGIMKYMYQKFLPENRVDAVVLAMAWNNDAVEALPATIEFLRQYANRVYIVGLAVRYKEPLPLLLARSLQNNEVLATPAVLDNSAKNFDVAITNAADKAGALFVSVYDVLCDKSGNCQTTAGSNEPIQYDESHLTPAGSDYVAKQWFSCGVMTLYR